MRRAVLAAEILTDTFSSRNFTAGGWEMRVTNGRTATATVTAGAVHAGDLGARLTSTSTVGATASIRKTFATQNTLAAEWDANVESRTAPSRSASPRSTDPVDACSA